MRACRSGTRSSSSPCGTRCSDTWSSCAAASTATTPPSPSRSSAEFDVTLRKLASYLLTEDVELYRNFARRWIATRIGEGFAPENLLHSAVAIVDIAQRVAQVRIGTSAEYPEFARALAGMSFTVARLLVEILAEELGRRSEQLRAVREAGQ
jgi:hypothetical protein